VSFKVLVIAEDPTWNGYILKPLTKALLADVGKPAAQVELLTNPRVQGYARALTVIRKELPGRYNFFDLWLFFPDADRATPDAARRLEEDLAARRIKLFCCPAQPEVEIFACVAYHNDLKESWNDVRKHPRMKEDIFQPLVERRADEAEVGGGRRTMIERSLRNLPLLYRLCPETKHLRDRIVAHLQGRTSVPLASENR
jgi:hypothetical protein